MNSIVKVVIDRPLGSYHPKHKDIYYSVNYGYVPGIIAPDGEEQDAYVLGINEPIKELIGKVVAIIHRNDDVEEKWVVVPQGMKITKAEIQEQVNFQEKYFDSLIEMLI
nr:inorganic pyrophosphatase [Clostridium sp.]